MFYVYGKCGDGGVSGGQIGNTKIMHKDVMKGVYERSAGGIFSSSLNR